MNSQEWNDRGWKLVKNKYNVTWREKTYTRTLLPWCKDLGAIKDRKQLAEILQVPFEDLLGTLTVTVKIEKQKHINRMYRGKWCRKYIERLENK